MRELDKVIGYDSIKHEMYRVLDVLQNPDKYEALGVTTPKGILLHGKPGIGKSLLAKCFIKESGRKSYIIRKDKPDGEFVDFISDTFAEAAENEPSIILLDDMDKFANEDEYHPNAEEYVTIQSCIDNVKDKQVFVIATVNDINDLPESLTRNGRFDRTFHMNFPKGKDAQKIIRFYLDNKVVADDIDVVEVARFCEGYSCADLETVVNEAGIYAGFDGRNCISQEDLKHACLHKLYRATEKDEELSQKIIERRAIHEAGHTVVQEVLNPGSVNFSTIVAKCRQDIGGLVSVHNGDGFGEFLEDKECQIMTALAGKAATEIIIGEVDMGSNLDMHKAFNMVRALIDDNTAYDFNSWAHGDETSQQVYDHLDAATGVEMARYYGKAKHILIKNRRFLDAVAKELTQKHTLSYKDIARIKEEIR